jgi:hypothetical protein
MEKPHHVVVDGHQEAVAQGDPSRFRLPIPFDRLASTSEGLLEIIEQEVSLWCAAGYKHLAALDSRRRSSFFFLERV